MSHVFHMYEDESIFSKLNLPQWGEECSYIFEIYYIMCIHFLRVAVDMTSS